MKPDQEKVRVLLVDTVALLCKNGLSFKKELKIQGLLGITVDENDVFIVHINEVFSESPALATRRSASDGKDPATPMKMVPEPVAEYNQSLSLVTPNKNVVPLRSGIKINRKRPNSGKTGIRPFKREKEDWREEETVAWIGGQRATSRSNGKDGNTNEEDSGDLASEVKGDGVVWIESDQLDEFAGNMESQPDEDFQNDTDLLSFNQPTHIESYASNVSQLPDNLNSVEGLTSSLKTEHGLEIKTEGGSTGRTHRRSGARKRSGKSSVEMPFAASASLIPSANNAENDWSENDHVNAQYPVATEISWDHEDENVQHEDYQEWLNWENSRGSNKRSAQNEEREKSFVCQYEDCDKAFYRKDHLIRHQRIKHGKPFGVDSQIVFYCHFAECGRMFYKNASLHRHMNEAHGYIRQD